MLLNDSPRESAKPAPWTVVQLTSLVRGALAGRPELDDALVEGEISNLQSAASGHMYFTLKDRWASLKCVCFRNERAGIPFRPADGMTIVVHGRIEVYDQGGTYQLYVDRMEPSGVGAAALAVRELRHRLATEGLFNERRKRTLPLLPRRVAVVTSAAGAALRDVRTVVQRRAPGLEVILVATPVQGPGAAEAIAGALREAAALRCVDVVLLVRGGGSIEDLAAFDSERVARAVAACPVPVVTGVGHETDTTTADHAADRRAPTPSAAAEIAVPVVARLRDDLDRRRERTRLATRRRLEAERERLHRVQIGLGRASPARRIAGERQRLDTRVGRLRAALLAELSMKRRQGDRASSRLALSAPQRRLALARATLRLRTDRLRGLGTGLVADRRQAVALRSGRLDALSPRRTIERGYSMTLDAESGRLVRGSATVRPGTRLRTVLREGEILSEVIG